MTDRSSSSHDRSRSRDFDHDLDHHDSYHDLYGDHVHRTVGTSTKRNCDREYYLDGCFARDYRLMSEDMSRTMLRH